MKSNLLKVCGAILFCNSLLALSAVRVCAQSPEIAQTATAPARITRAVDDSQRVMLRGNVHPLARAEFDRGVAPGDLPMKRMLMVLKRSDEQEKAMQQLLNEQMDASSPNFHKWLTPEEFGRRFGPGDGDIQTVVSWLRLHGFQVKGASHGRGVIEFSGNASQVNEAFAADMHRYVVKGAERWANASDPQIPEAIGGVVSGVVSLHNFPRRSMMHRAGEFTRAPSGEIRPLLTATGSSGSTFYALGPADFAKIYNVDTSTVTGAGQTIAIVGDSDFDVSDVQSFRSFFNLPPANLNIIFDGPNPGKTDDKVEALLDIEWAGAVAPQAQINYVAAEGTLSASGVDLAAVYVVDNNLGNILSESFGECEAGLGNSGNQFVNSLWAQAAAEGITVLVSSGDGAAAGCDNFNTATQAKFGDAVSGTASTPYNIAVGGTDFDDVGTQPTFWDTTNAPGTRLSAKSYIPETTWNESCAQGTGGLTACNGATGSALNIVGGSGGRSSVTSKPAWQNGVTPADGARDLPDVALFAAVGTSSKSFYVLCEADAVKTPATSCSSTGSFSFIGAGGTSASAPSMAGIIALISQATGQRIGNANYVLYKIAAAQNTQAILAACNSSASGGPASTCVFNDLTKGNISVPCAGGSPNCSSATAGTIGVLVDPNSPSTPAFLTGPGYDLATGLGSVNVTKLIAAWAAATGSLTATTTTTSSLTVNGTAQSAVNAKHGTLVSLSVNVTPAPGAAAPSESVTMVTDRNLNVNTFGNSTTVGGGILDGNGNAAVSTTALPGGTYNIFAEYAGDGSHKPSDSSAAPISVNITPESSQLQIGIVTFDVNTGAVLNTDGKSFSYGSPYILRMQVANAAGNLCSAVGTGGSSGCPSGNITVTDNGAQLDIGTFKLNSGGHAEDQPIQLAPGPHTLMASYSGDISFGASGPVTDVVSVTQASSTTTVSASSTSILKGGTVTLTAVVSTISNGAAPSGTVKFLNGSSPIAGTVTYTPVNGSASGPAKLTATLTTTITALLPPAGRPWRTPPAGKPYPWVLFVGLLLVLVILAKLQPKRRGYAYAGIAICVLLASGVAGCGGGGGGSSLRTVSISAQYSGDTNYTSSTSTATTITVQ